MLLEQSAAIGMLRERLGGKRSWPVPGSPMLRFRLQPPLKLVQFVQDWGLLEEGEALSRQTTVWISPITLKLELGNWPLRRRNGDFRQTLNKPESTKGFPVCFTFQFQSKCMAYKVLNQALFPGSFCRAATLLWVPLSHSKHGYLGKKYCKGLKLRI